MKKYNNTKIFSKKYNKPESPHSRSHSHSPDGASSVHIYRAIIGDGRPNTEYCSGHQYLWISTSTYLHTDKS